MTHLLAAASGWPDCVLLRLTPENSASWYLRYGEAVAIWILSYVGCLYVLLYQKRAQGRESEPGHDPWTAPWTI